MGLWDALGGAGLSWEIWKKGGLIGPSWGSGFPGQRSQRPPRKMTFPWRCISRSCETHWHPSSFRSRSNSGPNYLGPIYPHSGNDGRQLDKSTRSWEAWEMHHTHGHDVLKRQLYLPFKSDRLENLFKFMFWILDIIAARLKIGELLLNSESATASPFLFTKLQVGVLRNMHLCRVIH